MSLLDRIDGPLTPWLLIAWGASLAVAAVLAHHAGAIDERRTWEAREAKASAAAAQAVAAEIKAAAAASIAIAGELRTAAVAIASNRERTRVIVREVTHAVDADQNLAVRLPGDVVHLRREQSAASAATASVPRRDPRE